MWDSSDYPALEEHRKVEPYQTLQEMKTERIQQKEEDSTSVTPSIQVSEDSQWEPCIEAITEPHKYRVNSWDKTELDVKKFLQQHEGYLHVSAEVPLLLVSVGKIKALQTQELKPVQQLIKPDTERYFDKRPQSGQLFQAKLPALADTSTTSFDEKSVFPSYILEFEKKMKNHHIALLNQSQ